MKCQAIKKNTNKICRADLTHRIKIQTSYLSPNNSPNSTSSITFTTVATVWAMIKTNTAREFIDGVNIENGLNTDFYIYYNSAIPFDKYG
jgi:head-tail adaptor